MEPQNFCPLCGTSLSYNDENCPNCGKPIKSQKSIARHIEICAIIVSILGILSTLLMILLPAISNATFTIANILLIILSGVGTYISTVMFLGFAKLVKNSDVIAKK